MASIYRTRAIWTGFVGAPGYTNMYWQTDDGTPPASDPLLAAVHDFFDACTSLQPGDVKIQVQGDIAVIDEATGQQTAVLVGNTPDPVTSTIAGTYSAPSGACITWLTPGFHNGRGVKGRTFLVPLTGTAFDVQGSLSSTAITTLAAAAQALITNQTAQMVIWSRPTAKNPVGESFGVDQVLVKDEAAVLTSRRD